MRPHGPRKGGGAVKGVNRRVVEIAEPDSEYIERVLVFLRPQSGAVRVARQRAEAERYASGIVAWKRSLAPLSRGAVLVLAGAAVLGAVLGGLAVYFLL